ncbi:unnamed protein product [Caenorhabditis nigoni]
MASIIEMPELVLHEIIGFLDFKAVLTLRQVCHDFRNFIDDFNDSKLPESEFIKIKFVSRNDGNRIVFRLADSNDMRYRMLFSKPRKCRRFNGKTKDLGNSNIVDVAIRDLELVLKFQKSTLERLYFEFDDFQLRNGWTIRTLPLKLSNLFKKQSDTLPYKLSNMLKRLNRKIKTRELCIKTDNPFHIIPILQFVDPETLHFLDLSSTNNKMDIEFDEIAKTEQWKKAERMKCGFNVLDLNVEDICHFSSCSIRMNSMTAQELDFLRKTYTSSSNYKNSSFKLLSFNEIEELGNLWDPTDFFDSESSWLFRMKNSDERILHIEIHEDHSAHSTRKIVNFIEIPSSWVTPEAIIHDYNEN